MLMSNSDTGSIKGQRLMQNSQHVANITPLETHREILAAKSVCHGADKAHSESPLLMDEPFSALDMLPRVPTS
jgi:hypothetical protein